VLQGPHVVKPVRQLDDDHPRVPGDRQQQLPVVLHLLFGPGAEREVRQLGEAAHQLRDFLAELRGDFLEGDLRVLDHVVEQRGDDRGRVEELTHQDGGDGDAVGDEVLARHPALAAMGGSAELEGAIDLLEIEPVRVPLERRAEFRGLRHQGIAHQRLRLRVPIRPAPPQWMETPRPVNIDGPTRARSARLTGDLPTRD
jgi:hypothetical protein